MSLVVLPFEGAPGQGDLGERVRAFETEARLAFARNIHLSVVEFPETMTWRNPALIGRSLHVGYVVKTSLMRTVDGAQADVSLFDSETGVSVWSAPVTLTGQSMVKFAREYFGSVYPEIAIHRAKVLAATQPDSIPALLWRGEASRIRTRVGVTAPTEITSFEEVLKRDPDQLFALVGLAGVSDLARRTGPESRSSG